MKTQTRDDLTYLGKGMGLASCWVLGLIATACLFFWLWTRD